MKLTWTTFSGVRPKVDPRLLPDGAAQVAENVNTERGGLRPMPGTRFVTNLAKTGVQTIYRFGQALNSETQFWFHWDTNVDVAKGPIANDTDERTYWTGEGAPRYTTTQAATAGNNLPSASFPMGVAAPPTMPILTASGSAVANPSSETRVYIYTFVSVQGEESAPSAPVSIEIQTGQGVTLSNLETTAPNAAVLGTKRIYRAQRGVYLFVAEIAATAATYNDTVDSGTLSEPCPSIDWDLPPATMYGLKSGPNGMMLALDGYTVCMSEPYRPHAWPGKYQQTMSYPTVAVGQFGQSFVILTTGQPSVMTGSHPGNMSVATAEFYQPCVSARSVVSAAGAVIWASPDGLVSLGDGGEQNLTLGIFTPKQWRAMAPETLVGAWHEDWYVGSFLQNNVRVGFTFHPSTQEWIDLPRLKATAFYRDTVGDALYACVDDTVVKFRDGPDWFFRWKSQEVVTPLADFVVARVTGGYPVTFRMHRDKREVLARIVTSDEPFKLPAGLGRAWEIELQGQREVQGVVLGTNEGEM